MKRRLFLGFPLMGTGCSILPDRPFIAAQRFPLEPRREGPPRARGRHALLLRTMRAAPGLEARGLRRVRVDGTVEVAPYEEWLAPPADLAELALRQWLVATGRFSAVTSPGSRLATFLILETELVALQVEASGVRVAVAALLLSQLDGTGDPRPRGQNVFQSEVSVPANSTAVIQAAALQDALGRVFVQLEAWIVSAVLV